MFDQTNNNLSADIQTNQQYDNYGNSNQNQNDDFHTKLLELQQMQQVQIKTQKKQLVEKDEMIQFYEQKQYQLEKDFDFNLKVIEERDTDIDELTQKMMHLTQIVEQKNQFINSLQQDIENLKFNQHQTMQNIEDQKGTFYEKIDSFKFENKTLKSKLGEKIEENERLKISVDEMRKNIEGQIREAVNAANQVSQEKIQLLQIQLQQMKKENDDTLKHQAENRRNQEYTIQKQSDKLLLENENLLRLLNDEKLKSIESTKKSNEEASNLKQRLLDNQIVISTQQKEIEGLKLAQNNWSVILKEKMEIVNNEKDKLAEKINTKKHKHEQKMRELKDTMERKIQFLQEDTNSQLRQYEQMMRELRIENEKINLQSSNQLMIIQEKERKYQKEIQDLEDKFKSFRKNQEQTFKQQINEKNIADFHLKSKQDENEKTLKENADLKKKLEEIHHQIQDLEKENQLLIQEVVKTRKQPQSQQQQQQPQNNQTEGDQTNNDQLKYKKNNLQLQKGKKKVNNSSVQYDEDYLNPQNNQKNTIQNDSNILYDQQEDESIEKIFTGDEGPVSPLRSKNFNLDFLSNNKSASLLVNSIILKNKLNPHNPLSGFQPNNTSGQRKSNHQIGNNSKLLLDKIASLENEVEAYRHLIETLALEMENCNKESSRIKNENTELNQRFVDLQKDRLYYQEQMLKNERIQKAAFDKDQEIEEKEKELQHIQRRVEKHKGEIERLKREREQLISISSELREKLREQEDIIELKDQMISEYKDNYIFINKFDMRKPTQLHLSSLELATEQGSKQLGNFENNYPVQEEPNKDQSPFTTNKKQPYQNNNNSQSPNQNRGTQNKQNNQSNQSLSNQTKSNSKNNSKNISIDNKMGSKQDATISQKGFKKSVPKYDQFQDIDDFMAKNAAAVKSNRVNNFFNNVNDNDDNNYYDEDNKQQLYIKSNQKPLTDRLEDDKTTQYLPNSQKATMSQLEKLENEKKLQDFKRAQVNAVNSLIKQENIQHSPQKITFRSRSNSLTKKDNAETHPLHGRFKVRNYSIKDEDLN